MRRASIGMGLIVAASLLSVIIFSGSCAPARGFDSHLRLIVKPYLFSIAGWEFRAIPREVSEWIFGRSIEADDEVRIVTDYFKSTERVKSLKSEMAAIRTGDKEGDLASLEAELSELEGQREAVNLTVEKIIARQIKGVLDEEGIFNPIGGIKVSFPPLIFNLDKPPHLLVISPRNRIESIREITLQPGVGLEEMEAIEGEADNLGVSSLVLKLGGLATYPSLVTTEANLRFTLNTVTEEWLHQYLVFRPLGFRYLLDLAGLARNYEVATINETLAGMVSKEIGEIIYEKYYNEQEGQTSPVDSPDSEFNREMREIRRAVDWYLAQGEIEQAEQFMELKRQSLASKGYYIRKLNQAYFAFYGAYAGRPDSISPIGVELEELRQRTASLKGFLDLVSGMTGRQQIKEALGDFKG